MSRHFWCALLSGVVLFSLAACAAPARPFQKPTLRYTSLKGEFRLVYTASKDQLLIDITNPSGIGGAAIEKTSGDWPPKVVLRLHLRGLENFKFTYGTNIVEISVSATGQVREILTNGGQISTLSPSDANYMTVTHKPGYFDVEAPAAFLKSGENKFTIEWIDFYR